MLETIQTIYTRYSESNLRADAPPRALVEQVLEAAAQAPNHYKVRPWRFVVLTGPARERLGDLLAEILREKQPDLPPAALEKERGKPLRAPVLIAVGVDLPEEPKVLLSENICAAAAAAQNLLLAAHALGLGAIWRTGAPAYDPRVKEFLGFSADQPLIAFVYLGYAQVERPTPVRPDFRDRVTWMEE